MCLAAAANLSLLYSPMLHQFQQGGPICNKCPGGNRAGVPRAHSEG